MFRVSLLNVMKKTVLKIVSVFVALIIVAGVVFAVMGDEFLYPSYEETPSIKFAKTLGHGWNLGNTFDACEKKSTEKTGLEAETMWGNPETTKELIVYLKESGFDTVRIPVTWAQHMGDAPDYKIDEAWLDRVNEVVDWVLDSGMKAIINTHHDDAFWLITDYEHEEKSTEILTKVWAQICERFRDYDERLIFETMNEPRVFESEDEWLGTEERRDVVNHLNFAALETIRNSGGNNAQRYVMIPTYAASGLEENMQALELPDDDRVMVSVHYYYGTAHQSEFLDAEKKWTLADKTEMYKTFRNMYKYFISKGYGVVEGEFGWTDRENLENLAENAKYYVELAGKFGIPCAVWDNGLHFGVVDRNKLTQLYPEYTDAIT